MKTIRYFVKAACLSTMKGDLIIQHDEWTLLRMAFDLPTWDQLLAQNNVKAIDWDLRAR